MGRIMNMLVVWVLVFLQYAFAEPETSDADPAAAQLVSFKRKTQDPVGMLTTTSGEPVEYRNAYNTLNTNLLTNRHFLSTMSHFVRERIPERVVHAKGTGAFGYFEVTDDITNICKAKFLSAVGKKTPVAVRFSLSTTGKGGSDSRLDIRGLAIKFYTEQGNFDLLGIPTEMFALKDPVLFPPIVHSLTRNPATNLFDLNASFDFLTLRPETFFMFMDLFGGSGIPDGYVHMAAFPVHTFQVVNEEGESYFVRWHVIPDAGRKYLTNKEATRRSSEDSDFAVKYLYNAIENGTFPSWTVSLQILSFEDVKRATFDVFDTTKILPHDIYPLQRVGRLVLNRNPLNQFAEIEQLAFDPDNLVPGVVGGLGKLFEGRRLAYRDAQVYRLGSNFNKITVNCPLQVNTFNYVRDGISPVKDNGKDSPNYYPNSFHGPVPYQDEQTDLIQIVEDESANNFDQVREYYKNVMSDAQRGLLVSNLVTNLRLVTNFIRERTIKLLKVIVPDLANRVILGLRSNSTEIINEPKKHYKCL